MTPWWFYNSGAQFLILILCKIMTVLPESNMIFWGEMFCQVWFILVLIHVLVQCVVQIVNVLLLHFSMVLWWMYTVTDLWKFTPLHEASAKGKFEICRLLLEVGQIHHSVVVFKRAFFVSFQNNNWNGQPSSNGCTVHISFCKLPALSPSSLSQGPITFGS